MKELILTLKLKDNQLPLILSEYIISTNELKKIKKFLSNNFYFDIIDRNISKNTIEFSNYTIKYSIVDNKEKIKAFKLLYTKFNGTYDILEKINEYIIKSIEINDSNNKLSIKNLDDNDENNDNNDEDDIFQIDDIENDINYYIQEKKNTPEFSNIKDSTVVNYVYETNKILQQFKYNST